MVVCKFFQQGYCRYGQSCRFDHVYGSKYSYRAPQHTEQQNNVAPDSLFRSAVQNTNSIFGQSQSKPSVFDRLGHQPANQPFAQNQNAQSVFAQANKSVFGQSQTTQNVFGQSQGTPSIFGQNQPTPNIFGQNQQTTTSIFGGGQNASNVFQASQVQQNVFAQSQQTPCQPNIFQTQNQNNAAKSIFAQASQNIFGQAQQTTSIFAQESKMPANDPFGMQRSNQVINEAPKNVFHISDKPTSNVFGVTSNVFEQNNDDSYYYRILEDLPASDIEAFQCESFKLGYIPELPPPRSLCV